MSDSLLGVVLCGGQSKRMGRDKAALPCPAPLKNSNGTSRETFLSLAVARLRPLCDDVVVSGVCSVEHDLPQIEDVAENQGPIGGIIASLAHAAVVNANACLITAVDLPSLGNSDLEQLISHWRQSRQLTVAFSDRMQPLIAIYPAELYSSLNRYFDDGHRSLFRWIESNGFQSVALTAEACRNVNTPSDLP